MSYLQAPIAVTWMRPSWSYGSTCSRNTWTTSPPASCRCCSPCRRLLSSSTTLQACSKSSSMCCMMRTLFVRIPSICGAMIPQRCRARAWPRSLYSSSLNGWLRMMTSLPPSAACLIGNIGRLAPPSHCTCIGRRGEKRRGLVMYSLC